MARKQESIVVTLLASAMMTFPRLLSELLMFFVSSSLTPVAPDSFSRSLPARSTYTRPVTSIKGPRRPISIVSQEGERLKPSMKDQWDLND